MNGMITIELSGNVTPLTFGMLAIEEFGNRQAIGPSGWFKMITDLIYAGYCNEEVLNLRNPSLTYRDIAAGVDELAVKKDPILGEVFKCFSESKAGEDLLGTVKKKLEEVKPEPKVTQLKKKQTGTKLKNTPLQS